MALALVSLAIDIPVRRGRRMERKAARDVAMTGELTLMGKILKVPGHSFVSYLLWGVPV